ncbi:retrovirus-related pol polyprotein from transposon TNT 1-94 [Tanacetum coccineum]|uniref:Retrovirus-related pol polyprotein from transposon TNT 1-94 n=1 Tax=Tanacetum coccineum TaxID=301880 RepID=A0ABQ5FLI7_9ASTR
MTTLAEFMIVAGKKIGRMMVESIENGPLIYPTVEVDGKIRKKKYIKLTEQEQLQDDCDVQATNIVLQGLSPDIQPTPSVPQNTYHSPPISQQLPVEFPQINSGLAVLVFLLGDDPIACLNKAMAFLSTVVPSRRRDQSFAGTGTKGNSTTSRGNNAAGQERVVKCYNCQGEAHMARKYTLPKRPRNAVWFKEKLMLAEAHESSQVLDEEQLVFLADPGIIDCHDVQPIIIHNAGFQTDDLDFYDSDCDDICSAKAVLMANLSSYGSDVLWDNEITSDSNIISYEQYLQQTQNVIVQDTNSSTQQDSMIMSVFEQLSEKMSNHVTNWNKVNQETKTVNESLTAELERYKERVKTLEQRFNSDLNSHEKLIDSQMDDMIRNRCALKQKIDSLKQTLSNQVKEKESLLQTFNCFVDKKYFDIQKKEVSLDNDRLLDHIICQDVMNIVMNVDSVLSKAELAKKGQMVEKTIFDEVVLRCSQLKNRNVNLKLKLQHQKESFLNNNPLNNQNAPEILEFFKINEWQARLDAKDISIPNLREHIEKLKGKNVVEKDVRMNNPNVIALGMFKLDLAPLAPKLLNNRDAHIDYVKHSQEHGDILHEIVKHARVLRPLDSDLDSTRRTFTIAGKTCPLTRITSTSKSVTTQNPQNKVDNRRPNITKSIGSSSKSKVFQIVLWYLDSECSKHMTGNRSQIINFVYKFLGTVRFGNDQIAKIMGYGDYQMGNVTISQVYYVEVLGHNLFYVGQFCDSDLEVAFRKHTCYIRDLEGVDLLKGSKGTNLYTLSLEDMMLSSPICLLSKASKTKSWLWHRRLSNLNFDYITTLAILGLNIYNNDKSLSEIQLEHEKEDELVVVVVKVVHELDCRMVVKEIEDGLLEKIEVSYFGKEVMILEWISGESEDDKEKKLVMVNEEGWMS